MSTTITTPPAAPPVKAPAKAAPKPAEKVPAEALLEFLATTGTPRGVLEPFRAWLAEQGKETSAEALYRHMDATDTKQGTLRKAGKFVFGSEFEPESIVKLAPADELLRLRGENDRLAATVDTLRAEKLGLTSQNGYLREQINELTRKVGYLSMGRTKEDLEAAGIGTKS